MLTRAQRKHRRLCEVLDERNIQSYCEVGVLEGDSAWEVLCKVNPLTMILIDTWAPYPEFRPQSPSRRWDKHALKTADELEAMYQRVINRFKRYIDAGGAIILRSDSRKASRGLHSFAFDAIFIDADHRYEAVKRDIETYWPLVAPGGILIGDDYNTKAERMRSFWGVKKAADEFANKNNLELTLQRHKLWSMEKPNEP